MNPINESQWQAKVLDLAKVLGWHVAHFRPALTARGTWITAVAADGKGFPDLVMVRGTRVLFVELKSDKGRVTPEQDNWLKRLRGCPVEVYVWRPADWDEAMATLIRGTAPLRAGTMS